MNGFKIGDTVITNEHVSKNVKKGDICTITNIDKNNVRVVVHRTGYISGTIYHTSFDFIDDGEPKCRNCINDCKRSEVCSFYERYGSETK